MSKQQWISIIMSFGLIALLYFAFDTKPREQKEIERSRALVAESTDIQVLLKEAKEELGMSTIGEIIRLENELEQTVLDSAKVALYKSLSGEWYAKGRQVIAGYYAQQVAEIEQTEESWSIAGTTYTIGLQRSQNEKARQFAVNRAVQAFESAISINPDNTAHQVNLALVYTSEPPEDNPMKGIQMLLQLNKEQPENVLVLVNLGRLAIQTGQFDRAEVRLQKALEIDPNNKSAICLLANVYAELGNASEAEAFQQRCTNNDR
jgi:tetratricopeptide (TPR) repeat protein